VHAYRERCVDLARQLARPNIKREGSASVKTKLKYVNKTYHSHQVKLCMKSIRPDELR
jgi:hypothetical protein